MKSNSKNKILIFIIISIIIIPFLLHLIFKNTETENIKNNGSPSLSYEEFMEKYGEYNYEDLNITEDNYEYYKDVFFSRKYSPFIECEVKVINSEAFLIIKNNSDEYTGDIHTSIVFYDENDHIIEIQSVYMEGLEGGGKRISDIYRFPLGFSKVDFYNELDMPEKISKLHSERIKCEIIEEENRKKAKITNNNNEYCERLKGIVIFYDESQNAICYSYVNEFDGLRAEESKIETLNNYPYKFSNYEFFVSDME